MNKDRRRRLRLIIDQGNAIYEQLRVLQEEEQEAVDNIPESLQGTDRYADMEAAAEAMEEAVDSLNDIISSLEEIV